ncbi:hypothetical protein P7K49_024815 [Saguinus oedipus]|uniref:Uncharacterized protein n=1 Tax=Saguinus oedipus TaxID=9490 RepID=A0ABQ9UQK6_SAGOE|nr:hypothetical protein P7K49_024815 [Saguinus oedipus]
MMDQEEVTEARPDPSCSILQRLLQREVMPGAWGTLMPDQNPDWTAFQQRLGPGRLQQPRRMRTQGSLRLEELADGMVPDMVLKSEQQPPEAEGAN